jgi:hypothetical protein
MCLETVKHARRIRTDLFHLLVTLICNDCRYQVVAIIFLTLQVVEKILRTPVRRERGRNRSERERKVLRKEDCEIYQESAGQ